MAKLPPLARTVAVGTTYYRKGDTPPLHHARKITGARNWEGGKTPDFDAASEPTDPATGVTNSSAANAQRTGLPGFREGTGTETGGEGAGTGDGTNTGTNTGAGTNTGTGTGDDAGDGDGADTTGNNPEAPATGDSAATRTTPRKVAPVKATTPAK